MLERIDQQIFLFLNSLNSPFWDQVMYIISAKVTWIPLYIAILIAIGFRYKKKLLVIILMIIIAVTLSDQFSVILKNIFQRLRPCHEPVLEGLVHLVKGKCGGLYGFVSSHAANSFMVAVLSLLLIKRRWFTCSMIFWAILVSYSRIYLGVHYPGDVIWGAVLGVIIGWGINKLYEITDKKLLRGSRFFNSVDTL